jgi:ribosomal protein L17
MSYYIDQEIIEFKRGRDKKKRKRRRSKGKIMSKAKFNKMQNRRKAVAGASLGLVTLGIAAKTPKGQKAIQSTLSKSKQVGSAVRSVVGTAKGTYQGSRRTGASRLASAKNAAYHLGSRMKRKK